MTGRNGPDLPVEQGLVVLPYSRTVQATGEGAKVLADYTIHCSQCGASQIRDSGLSSLREEALQVVAL